MSDERIFTEFGNKIIIPNGALRCVVRVRHAPAEKLPGNNFRTLSLEGEALCHQVAPAYDALIKWLAGFFGTPRYEVEPNMEVIQAALAIFNQTFIPNAFLKKVISMKDIPDPTGQYTNWLEWAKANGWTMGEMISHVAKNHMTDRQAYGTLITNCRMFFGSYHPGGLMVGVDSEPTIGLMALNLGAQESVVGLNYCEANIFFFPLDGHTPLRTPLAIQKFAP